MTLLLETERLLIRPFAVEDLAGIHALVYADERVRATWSGYRGALAEFRERFETDAHWRARDGWGFLALVPKAGGGPIGLMGFQRYEPGEELGYLRFADPADQVGAAPGRLDAELTYALGFDFQGRGYALEAGRALVPFGFGRLGIGRIVNSVSTANPGSILLMERLGFRIEPNLAPLDPPRVLGVLERPGD
ncbi:MAG TPA: GNAT family N-acetyltransferase [Herpetosiphonaceae bacterium]